MKIIIFDIDGTIADSTHRVHFLEQDKPDWDNFLSNCEQDKPIKWTIDLLRILKTNGYLIYLVTGRTDNIRGKTINWLNRYNIPYDKLFMRQTGDHRHDYEIKLELINDFINDIWFAVDDKQSVVDKFREIGINVLQCGVDPIPDIMNKKRNNMKSDQIRKIAEKISSAQLDIQSIYNRLIKFQSNIIKFNDLLDGIAMDAFIKSKSDKDKLEDHLQASLFDFIEDGIRIPKPDLIGIAKEIYYKKY